MHYPYLGLGNVVSSVMQALGKRPGPRCGCSAKKAAMNKVNLFTVAAAGLGVFALYKLLKPRPQSPRFQLQTSTTLTPRFNAFALLHPQAAPVDPAAPTAPKSFGAPTRPETILGNLTAVPGSLYRAAVMVFGSAAAAASPEKIQKYAEGEGFQEVHVSTAMPPGWPGAVLADYYVTGIFAGSQPKQFPREHNVFLGSVKLVDAFKG
jgi:hypothetical protein